MKKFVIVSLSVIGIFALSCGLIFNKPEKYETCTIEGNFIICPDGTSTEIKQGAPGLDAPPAKDGKDGVNGTSCYTYNTLNGAVIVCQDSSSTVSNGSNGSDGSNGVASIITVLNASSLECPTGGKVFIVDTVEYVVCNGADGVDGAPAPQASPGKDGVNGHNSLFTSVSATSLECSNGGSHILMGLDIDDDHLLEGNEVTSSITLCNGTNGSNGTNVPLNPYDIVGILNPCGDSPSVIDEIFLKLANNTLIASFSDNANGKNTRFSVVPVGTNLRTTDGDECIFSLDSNGNLYNEHH